MKINYKKSLKLITLLISAILIATVSATAYSQMFLNATVSVEGLTLKWMPGTETANIVSSTCTLPGLKGTAGQTSIYDDAVEIKNEGTAAVSFSITVQACDGSTTLLTSIIIELYEGATSKGNLTVWAGGKTGDPLTGLQIDGGSTWKFRWEITWSDQATTSDSVNVKLVLDVG
jgi:hypothetical protein